MVGISANGVRILGFSVGLIFCCCAQNACLEAVLVHDRRGGSLVTFIQYLSVVIIQSVTNGIKYWKHRQIPIWIYFLVSLVLTFINKANNTALTWGISLALSTLYRSCTVAMSLAIGIIVFGKTYSKWQVFGALGVTIGIVMCTLGDEHLRFEQTDAQGNIKETESCGELSAGAISCSMHALFWKISTIWEWKKEGEVEWLAGLLLITNGLFAGVMLGHFQDRIYRTYANKVTGEKPYQEYMFFLHIFSLPMLLGIDYNSFRRQLITWIWEQPLHLTWRLTYLNIELQFSELAVLLFGCVIFNYGCVSFAYALSASTSTVALNIVLTTRKACTILLSVFWFGTTFTFRQWLGSAMVLAGALLFSVATSGRKETPKDKKDKKE